MALFKRNEIWWIDIHHKNRRIRKSTGTKDRLKAKRLHDKISNDLWKEAHLNETPDKYWVDAVLRFLGEANHKSLEDDKRHLKWVDPYLVDLKLKDITRDMIEKIALAKEKTGVKPATVNRMLEVIRKILKKAASEWEWLDKYPAIRMRPKDNKRIRFLTKIEAWCLLKELPSHLRAMAEFTLATGLRESNVTGLKWSKLDLLKKHAWINSEDIKTKKALAVPLNKDAIRILTEQLNKGTGSPYVFTYQGQPIKKCNRSAWRRALKRAALKDFRWHDLRHTWASWHIQNGTSLQELQQLGGWSSFDMVLRYAHLSSDHLKEAAEKIVDTKMPQDTREEKKKVS